jgi:acylphosphatase
VRNLRDGTVEAEVECTAEQVDDVLSWMAEGPPGSSVTSARVTERDPVGGSGFDVRRDG